MKVFFAMNQSALLALVAMVTLVSCDVTIQESPSVLDRLGLMEQQQRQQNDVIQQLRQQNDVIQQLRQQNDVIQQLRQENHVQAVRLSDLDHLIRQQEDRLSEQEKMIKLQGNSLSQQDSRLSEQENTIRLYGSRLYQHKNKLSQQEKIDKQQKIRLSEQDARLSEQDTRLSRQDARLSEQEKIISQQQSRIVQQNRLITKYVAKNFTPITSLKSTSPQSLQEQDSGTSVTSTHHDVIARSDDTGALGVVVNEMNQRVTQMSASIQALENTDTKHASDIQALKASRTSDIHAMTLANQHQDQAIHDARSSSFVRWGSSHCPHNSSLVYSGVVGGSLYTHPGSAVNYLCLTMSPVFGGDRSFSQSALLYGGEYQTFDSHENRDPVCAVCRASFSTTITIPGTNVCTHGWTPLYSGYLMADLYEHTAGSEFVCVDSALESRPGTTHNDNGKLFYFTKTRCGSLPCGPYVNDKIVTCVVCGQ